MLRTSEYNIYVGSPGAPEDVLLVHGYRGSFDRVSRRVATYLRSRERTDGSDAPDQGWRPQSQDLETVGMPAADVLDHLQERGYLVDNSLDERSHVGSLVGELHDRAGTSTLTFLVSYGCNLACPYCFQGELRSADRRLGERVMEKALVDRALHALWRLEKDLQPDSGAKRGRSVTLYGGEPLQRRTRGVVRHIVERVSALGSANVSAITNGLELHHFLELLGPEMIGSLQVSLDGPPAGEDEAAPHRRRRTNFEKIVRNIDTALRRGVEVRLRINVDRHTLPRLPEVGAMIRDAGWDRDGHRFSAYVSPITSSAPEVRQNTLLTSTEVRREVIRMRVRYPFMQSIQPPAEQLRHELLEVFLRQGRPKQRPVYCGAHAGSRIVDPNGDVYACLERVGDPEGRIGFIDRDGSLVVNRDVSSQWRSRTVARATPCDSCRYALFCGGGCAANAQTQGSGFWSGYCDDFAHRFQESALEVFTLHRHLLAASEHGRVAH